MKRRDFLKNSGIVAGVTAASALATPAIAQDRRELKLVTTWPKNFPGLGTAPELFAKMVNTATEGRIDVKVYAAGELVPAFESFDAVSSGAADMYHGADYYWVGKHKAFAFFTAVPFGMTANENDSWLNFGGGQELWDELAGGFNLKCLPCGNTGVQMGGWFKNPITSLDDLKGLKMRIPGLGGEVLRRLGVSTVTLPGGEIFAALQSGAIDATEWVGPWNDLAFGFHKIVKNYMWPGFHEPGPTLSLGFNKGVWESFSVADQELLRACSLTVNHLNLAEFNARNNDALKTLIEDHGVKLHKMPDDVLNAIGEKSGEVAAEVAEIDDIGKRTYESFVKFRTQSIAWSKLSDQGFWNARLLPFNYGSI
ncbi:MAG: TRAP transporter substrate-binding protein [Alphaproteobacteria bacterium]